MDTLKSPVIVIGLGRSGTSMVQSYLSKHPDLVSWVEPRTIWRYADPGRKHERFTELDATKRVREYISKRFLKFQEQNGGYRIVEKTPSNVLRIPYVHSIFPDSKIIYIVRNPLDQISSAQLKWHKPPTKARKVWVRLKETPKLQLIYYLPRLFREIKRFRRKTPLVWGIMYPGIQSDLKSRSIDEVNALQWLRCADQADQDLSKLPSETWIRVRYEDIVRDPVGQFRKMFAHLNIDLPQSVEDAIGNGVRPDSVGKWRRMEPEAVRRCLSIVAQPMRRYGYVPPSESDYMMRNENGEAQKAI